MAITKSLKFMRDVRAEANRITWPNLADTRMMTLMVFILVLLVSVYLMLIDMAVSVSLNWMLGV